MADEPSAVSVGRELTIAASQEPSMDRGNGGDDSAAAPPSPPAHTGEPDAVGAVQVLLERWQSTADEVWLERLLAVVTPTLQQVARRILGRHGIRDPDALDDAVSLVFDHVRRLPCATGQERRVSPFERHRSRNSATGDAGLAYVAWLARERAMDVVRRQRRRQRRCRLLDDGTENHLRSSATPGDADGERSAHLRAAIARLPPRERRVCDLLLDGRSQAEIAGLLGLCAGTVSRIRQRMVNALRDGIDAP